MGRWAEEGAEFGGGVKKDYLPMQWMQLSLSRARVATAVVLYVGTTIGKTGYRCIIESLSAAHRCSSAENVSVYMCGPVCVCELRACVRVWCVDGIAEAVC